jgi:hypothetical protein
MTILHVELAIVTEGHKVPTGQLNKRMILEIFSTERAQCTNILLRVLQSIRRGTRRCSVYMRHSPKTSQNVGGQKLGAPA